jgi:hypothetical protein
LVYAAGTVATVGISIFINEFAHFIGYGQMRRRLYQKLRPQDGALCVELSPGGQARVHGGFTEWDVGFCSLAPGMMTYLGERISFSLQGTSTRPPDGLYRRPFDAGAIRDYR